GALAAIERPNAFDLPGQLAGVAVLVDDGLVEHSGAEIGGLLGDLDAIDQRLRPDDPSAAHTGRQNFREGAEVQDAAVAVAGFDRSRVGTLDINQIAVWIVLNDQKIVPVRDLEDSIPPALRHEATRRILEIWNCIQ